MKKGMVAFVVLLMLLVAQGAVAQEIWQIEKQFKAMEIIYLSGHDGDLNQIEGLEFLAELYWNGAKIGYSEGALRFLNPPLDLDAKYASAFIIYHNDIPGNGIYQVNAQGIAMFSSGIYSGKGTFAYAGSICEGTNNLESMVGLAEGIGEFDLVKKTGTLQETISVRMGY